MVIDPSTGDTVFQSPAIPGATQTAWEDGSDLLVLARDGHGEATVTRCNVDEQRCEKVWTFAEADRLYGVWLVVTPPASS